MDEENGVEAAATASIERRSERRSPPLLNTPAPWLVIPYGKGMKNQAFYNISQPNNRTCRKFIPELSGKRFWQKPSHQGWLIILCHDNSYDYTPNWNYGDCFLWNPASFEMIRLPCLLYWIDKPKQYEVLDCVLSSPPVKNGNDSMVFFLLYDYLDETCEHLFLYCHLEDKQWRTEKVSRDVAANIEVIRSIHYFRGKLYAMANNKNSYLEIETVKRDDGSIVKLSISRFEPKDCTRVSFLGGSSFTSRFELQFMESCDELFRICMAYSVRNRREVYSIDVARLDFSLMKWKDVNSFGDHVLFCGQNTTACCSASELGLVNGCLYYTVPGDQSIYKFVLPSTGVAVTLPCLKLPKPWFASEWIIMLSDEPRRMGTFLGEDEKGTACISKALENRICAINIDETEIQGKIHNKGELGEGAPWSILDEDSLQLITNYLHRVDYLHFRLVSKVNQAIMPLVKPDSAPTSKIVNTTYSSPWLLFCKDNVYNFVNPQHDNEKYLMKLPDLAGTTIRCQKGGWLLLSDDYDCLFFYNPFTRESISGLPRLPFSYIFSGITFSSSPTSSDCTVFGIQQSSPDSISIYFNKKGEWYWNVRYFNSVNVERYYPLRSTPVIKDGFFYFIDYNGTLGVFSLEDHSWKVLEKPLGKFSSSFPSFLVECGQDILLVKLDHLGTSVGVFRFNSSKMVWDDVKSLGRHMLFISYTSCFSAIAPNSRMENKIYFPRLFLDGEGVVFYSLDTGKYHSFGSEHSANNFYETEGWQRNCTWIEPNWAKSNPQDLGWRSSSSRKGLVTGVSLVSL